MKPVVFHRAAADELENAAAYYEFRKPGLGAALQREVERVVRAIQENPRSGTRYKTGGIRRRTLRRFPYTVFYTELPKTIWIIAVAHGRRNPSYWKNRRIG